MPDDVRLMAELGLTAYRFSISWPRVQPGGRGRLAPAGLDFYDRLVDELLGHGVQPWVTLYHWDLPSPLQESGGWADRDTADRFTDYAVAVHAALGDRVRHWLTLNEPWSAAWLGHGAGVHAPGVRDRGTAVRAAHVLLLAHGRATRELRRQASWGQQIGIALNLGLVRPARGRWGDPTVKRAVRIVDAMLNRWWLGALLDGGYPQDALSALATSMDGVVLPGDVEDIAQPLDLLGVNYAGDQLVDVHGRPERSLAAAFPLPDRVTGGEPGEATASGSPVTPQGFRDLLVRIVTDHPSAPPLVITENGAAYTDVEPPAGTGVVEDPRRVSYLTGHLGALAEAIDLGVDVRGYFARSLLDGFEWSHGYTQRFGLVHVDFETQERRRKRSFEVYRDVIARARRSVLT